MSLRERVGAVVKLLQLGTRGDGEQAEEG